MTEISALVAALDTASVDGPTSDVATAICQDSRQVCPGAVFVAVPGGRTDGHAHLARAVAEGARVLVVQDDRRTGWVPEGVTVVRVPDSRAALGRLAAAFHDFPARSLSVVGITGTDGKTSTTFLTSAVLSAGGLRTAFVSTAGRKLGDTLLPNDTHLTTPDVVAVQRFLAAARDGGADCAIVEATSQGLDQGRLAHLEPDVAVLTNLTTDHLDYHGTPAAYLEAKAKLFAMLGTGPGERGGPGKRVRRTAILNVDSGASAILAARTGADQLWYGIGAGGVRAERVVGDAWGTRYQLHTGAGEVPVALALPGRFNVVNSLAAAAVGVAFGVAPERIGRGLAAVTQVPGRMQPIEAGQPFGVVVDYAHNPHELRQVLSFLRWRAGPGGRVIAVFGCAGDRDPGRRRQMGRVAAELADFTVVTSENTWTEQPEMIMAEVMRGLVERGRRPDRDYACRLDRREAIRLGLSRAGEGDMVLVAGMGHEPSMIIGGREVPWDDRQVVHDLLVESLTTVGRS